MHISSLKSNYLKNIPSKADLDFFIYYRKLSYFIKKVMIDNKHFFRGAGVAKIIRYFETGETFWTLLLCSFNH